MLLMTGVSHIVIIKGEYHLGARWWPLLPIIGPSSILVFMFVESKLLSGILGTIGFVSLWSIYELQKTERTGSPRMVSPKSKEINLRVVKKTVSIPMRYPDSLPLDNSWPLLLWCSPRYS
jgi:hypothetical protein